MHYFLHPEDTDPKRVRAEREKARQLRKSSWWQQKLTVGVCHYCGQKVDRKFLTMDHIVPLARGGRSTKGNLVPCCSRCNAEKRLDTPVERLMDSLDSTA